MVLVQSHVSGHGQPGAGCSQSETRRYKELREWGSVRGVDVTELDWSFWDDREIAPAPHDPEDYPNTPDESFRGNVRRTPRPRCAFCGELTKLIGRKLFCRACGYAEGCCDGGKEAIREGELREGEC